MPLYEYQCQECENRFERIERVSAPSDGVCPSCGGAARRLLGAPALQFKGSGWYVTDYGKGNGNGNGNGSSPSTETEPKVESKTESKTETATKTDSSSKSDAAPKSDTKVA